MIRVVIEGGEACPDPRQNADDSMIFPDNFLLTDLLKKIKMVEIPAARERAVKFGTTIPHHG